MKKLVIAVLAAAIVPTLGFAQGQIGFGTADAGTQYITLDDGLTRAPAGVVATLWWSPDNVAPYTEIGVNAVTVNGWLTTMITLTTGAATAPGASAWFYVSASNGALYGETPRFQNATSNPAAEPPPVVPSLDGWTSPIIMVPEPSTLALAGIGLAGLLAFRRRS